MSYQVLARKWRPQRFHDVAGQGHVLQALINALDHNRLHHAYLFTGTRGVGKTTIARILAKCLNCETGVSSQPCGQCGACREISEGRFVDLIEIDAASRTKVEDTRDLLDNVQYLPARGRFKVYLIDEVHMLSNSSFNALLKTLEEPPEHVKFLLATTDPHKLPVTVLSRCLQFNLKNLPPERIGEQLRTILNKEMIPFDDEAVSLLSRAADGSMRDALSLTDQAIAFGNEALQGQVVRDMLGTLDRALIHPLLTALAQQDVKAMLAAVAHLAEQNPDFPGALETLLQLLHHVCIAQAVPESLDLLHEERHEIELLACSLTAEDVQLFYQIGLQARRDIEYAPDLRSGFEMALLRMMAFRPEGVFDTAGAAKKKTELSASVTTAPQAHPTSRVSSLLDALSMTTDTTPAAATSTTISTQSTLAPAVLTPAMPSATYHSPPPTPAPQSGATLSRMAAQNNATILTPDTWAALWQTLPLAGVVRNTASHCYLHSVDNLSLSFILDSRHTSLFDPSHAQRLGDALSSYLGAPYQVTITLGTPAGDTPHTVRQNHRAAQQQAAETEFHSHPVVQTLLQHVDGKIIDGSLTPLHTLH